MRREAPYVKTCARELSAARRCLAERGIGNLDVGIILGSGLEVPAATFAPLDVISTRSIPHFPPSTAPGHPGELVIGSRFGRRCAVLRGRVHHFEGYSLNKTTFGLRLLSSLGVRRWLLCNSVGSISPDLHPNDLVSISDHLNVLGRNVLMPERAPRLYSDNLRQTLRRAAAAVGMPLGDGVYAAVGGPSFETPAEIRALGVMGADVVGMSTVAEALCARALGSEVAAVSVVTAYAAGVTASPVVGDLVIDAGRSAAERLGRLLIAFLAELGAQPHPTFHGLGRPVAAEAQ